MVGSIAPNLHEGSRSEYLAQYVFASFGTAISVPHQEDSGIDLYCTLTERIGRRAWPKAYFSVQVKSTMAPWIFNGKESVRWLIKHPTPLFLCVVEKKAARLRIYHTSPRFYLWSHPPLPKRVKLIPQKTTNGRCTEWESATEFSLSSPILEFSIKELLEDNFRGEARRILEFWIETDMENLGRVSSGIHWFKMPYTYHTNQIRVQGNVTQGITTAPSIKPALNHLKEALSWMNDQFYRRGNLAAAARGAMLLRHLFRDDRADSGFAEVHLHNMLNQRLRRTGYLYAGVDSLNAAVAQRLRSAK